MADLFSEISKPVISLADSSVCGVVKDAYFDEMCRKIAYFAIGDRPYNSADKLRLLPFECVQATGDALMITSADCMRADVPEGCISMLIGKPAYTLAGAFKGNVTDVKYSASGKVSKLTTDCAEFPPSCIAQIGDAVLLKSVPKTGVKTKIPRPSREEKVYLAAQTAPSGEEKKYSLLRSGAITTLESAPQAISLNSGEPAFTQDALNLLLDGTLPATAEPDAHTPTRIICDYEFLLGRTLGADLNTYGGQLIAPKGSEVTAATVEKARYAGKLVELTLNSVRQ